MTVSRLIFKLLYPFCSPSTKIILGNMDAKAATVQFSVYLQLKDDIGRTWGLRNPEPTVIDFSKWIEILELGTFNPVEQIAIKAALYNHRRAATKKIIFSTLVDGEYAPELEENEQRELRGLATTIYKQVKELQKHE